MWKTKSKQTQKQWCTGNERHLNKTSTKRHLSKQKRTERNTPKQTEKNRQRQPSNVRKPSTDIHRQIKKDRKRHLNRHTGIETHLTFLPNCLPIQWNRNSQTGTARILLQVKRYKYQRQIIIISSAHHYFKKQITDSHQEIQSDIKYHLEKWSTKFRATNHFINLLANATWKFI